MTILGLFALVAMFGCEGQPDNGGGETLSGTITLLADKDIIKANGEDVAFLTVLLLDESGMMHDISAEATIYYEGNDNPITTNAFTTTESREWAFYALYGYEVSNEVKVQSVAGVADLPADPKAASTDFHHRMLLVQHTGTTCTFCPNMMNTLKRLSEKEEYNTLYNHVASHSYTTIAEGDPAYSKAASTLSREVGVKSYPWLTFDLTTNTAYELEEIQGYIDINHDDIAKAGVSASARVVDGVIYVNAGVKAGATNLYRVAAWVLEDNIQATQTGATASWQHRHNNCLREMAGVETVEKMYGKEIGTIEAGKSVERILAIDIAENWKIDNCKLLVIVTAGDGRGGFEVVNSSLCPIGGEVTYQYN
jgi:hypothetical protein